MRIALLGYGKMGKAVEALALAGGHEIVLKISSGNLLGLATGNLAGADVAIEFSRPESAFENIRLCLESGVPVVSGTTGWLERFGEARSLCLDRGGALLYASNFSIGVNIFFALNRFLAGLMDKQPSYEVGVEEIHHLQKLDAPSGTAITIAEDILERLARKEKWVNRQAAGPSELPVISIRKGQVPGTHTVSYVSAIDSISIRHEAYSREGFARGALMAAEWVIGKKGCFGMRDMLGI
jgi:4-hydroxy-tetrahydrodipicolinate reductase